MLANILLAVDKESNNCKPDTKTAGVLKAYAVYSFKAGVI